MNKVIRLLIITLTVVAIISTVVVSQPATPTGLTVTSVTQTQINLTWNAVSGATNYAIYQDGSCIQTISGTSYSAGVSCGTTHNYYVKAGNPGGSSGASNTVIGTAVVCTPAAPTGLTVTSVTQTQINLSWNAVSGAGWYVVYQDGSAIPQSIYSTSFSVGVSCGTTHSYYVKAVNVGGSSGASNTVTGTAVVCTPAAPTGLTLTSVTQTQINLSWNAVSGAGWYVVYQDGSAIPQSIYSTSFSVGVSCGTTHSYYVKAVNVGGSSGASNTVTGTAVVCTPAAPTGLTVTSVTQTQINLSWNAVSGAGWYVVYQDGSAIPQSIYSTSFSVGVSCGTTHSYYVQARNAGGWSAASNSVTGTAAPCTFTLSTSSSPSNGGTTSGGGTYNSGTQATVTASPASGYAFAYWSGDASGSTNPLTVTMNGNKSITANYSVIQYSLSTSSSPSNGGTTSGGGTYNSGTQATVTASPANGYVFAYWSGSASGSTNPISVTMNGPKSVTANYLIQYSLSTSSSPSNGGTTSGAGTYNSGTQATVTATPATGYTLAYWSGDASGSTNPLIVTMNSAKNITANYSVIRYALSATSNPSYGGTTSGGGTYDIGTPVTVTATPATGYTFSYWSGDASGSSNPVTVTMNGPKSVTANYSVIQYSLSTSSSPSNGGTTSGGGTYNSGTQATVTASPASGYTFAYWSGDASGSTNPISVTMNGNKNVIATFTPTYTLTITAVNGTVTESPNQGSYINGTQVQLTASPKTGYTFTGWNGSVIDTSNPITITMNGNKNITAYFASKIESPLSIRGFGMFHSYPDETITDLSNSFAAVSANLIDGFTNICLRYTYPYAQGYIINKSNNTARVVEGNNNRSSSYDRNAQIQGWKNVISHAKNNGCKLLVGGDLYREFCYDYGTSGTSFTRGWPDNSDFGGINHVFDENAFLNFLYAITSYVDFDAVQGWYIADEADAECDKAEYDKMYNAIKNHPLAKNKPVYVTLRPAYFYTVNKIYNYDGRQADNDNLLPHVQYHSYTSYSWLKPGTNEQYLQNSFSIREYTDWAPMSNPANQIAGIANDVILLDLYPYYNNTVSLIDWNIYINNAISSGVDINCLGTIIQGFLGEPASLNQTSVNGEIAMETPYGTQANITSNGSNGTRFVISQTQMENQIKYLLKLGITEYFLYGWNASESWVDGQYTYIPTTPNKGDASANWTANEAWKISFSRAFSAAGGFAKRAHGNDEMLSEEYALTPNDYALSQNYPNPFNPSTVIKYQLPTACFLKLVIYDMLGREVSVLAEGIKDAGYYSAVFDGTKFSSGVYFTRFTAQPQNGNKPFAKVMKMLLTK